MVSFLSSFAQMFRASSVLFSGLQMHSKKLKLTPSRKRNDMKRVSRMLAVDAFLKMFPKNHVTHRTAPLPTSVWERLEKEKVIGAASKN